MATSKDVAKLAGVSYATVCRVFRNEGNVTNQTKRKVLEAAKQLNYSPNQIASNLKRGQSNTIAFLDPDPKNPFYMRNISAISECLRKEYGYHTLMIPDTSYSERVPEAMHLLLSYRVDGIIFSPIRQNTEEIESLRELIHAEQRCKFLQLHASIFDEIDSITYDEYMTMYSLTCSLIDHGDDNILLLTNDSMRAEAFQKAYQKHGLSNDSPIFSKAENFISVDDCVSLIQKYKPKVIITIAEMLALNVLEAITRLGLKTPDDLFFIVYDEVSWAKALGITTVSHEEEAIAICAAERIYGLINRTYTEPKHMVIPSRIIYRSSYPDPQN